MKLKARSIRMAAAVCLVLAAPTACTRPDLEADKAQIEQAINNSIGWALTKDTVMLYDCLAHDSTFFIYHPSSEATVIGWEAFTRIVDEFWMDPAFRATRFEVKDLRINLSQSGKVAWYSALLDDFAEWQGQPVGWENARWTGILEKRNGRWVITQMHFSFAVEQIRAEDEEAAEG
jgi:hypothetical protein